MWVYWNIIIEVPHSQSLIQKVYKKSFQGIDIYSIVWGKCDIIQNSFGMSNKLPHSYLYLLPGCYHVSSAQHAF